MRRLIGHFRLSTSSHIGDELPAKWIRVREEIETLAQSPFAPVQEYFDVYSKHMEFDRTRALHLSRYLHDLVLFLHFQDDPLLARIVIWRTLGRLRRFTGCLTTKGLKAARAISGAGIAIASGFGRREVLRDASGIRWL